MAIAARTTYGLPLYQNNVVAPYIFPVYTSGVTPAGGNNVFLGYLAPNSNSIVIVGTGTATPAGVQASALAGTAQIVISGSYHV